VKGYRKLTVTIVCSAMTFVLALCGIAIAAPYMMLGTACTAFCAANLIEHHRANPDA